MMAVAANRTQTSGKLEEVSQPKKKEYCEAHINRQMAPALLEVAFFNIARSGVAAESMILLISPATKSRTTRNIVPVTVPIPTQ